MTDQNKKSSRDSSGRTDKLVAIARALVAPGRGILAADESHPTMAKRFKAIEVVSVEDSRRSYRELLFTTTGLAEFISGVILFDETLRQRAADGTPLVTVLDRQGLVPGIKVDKGTKPLAGFPGETITEGLDGLRERLAEYAHLGARFTKWRAVIVPGAPLPSRTGVESNAHALARFAALSQEAGLVPIVEPEVLMDGDHSIERHGEVTAAALRSVFAALADHRVDHKGMLLKSNMVLSGKTCPHQATPEEVAEATLHWLLPCVPADVPGIVFLSGGQSSVQATENLNALNRLHAPGMIIPWQLSFSFGRALQEPVLKAWRGRTENTPAAQAALLHRARCNGAARFGRYSEVSERVVVT